MQSMFIGAVGALLAAIFLSGCEKRLVDPCTQQKIPASFQHGDTIQQIAWSQAESYSMGDEGPFYCPTPEEAALALQGERELAGEQARRELVSRYADEVALALNLNGRLCASVEDIQPVAGAGEVYEVTCVEYRGGAEKVRYTVDLSTRPGRVSAAR